MSGTAYRKRLKADLDRWLARGLLLEDQRAAILADLGEVRPALSAAGALGIVGATLLGLAVIALFAANWDAIPRLGRPGLVLAVLWAGLIGAARVGRTRPLWAEGLTLIAALVFAAGIGLVGQMYNIPGEPRAALALAALGGIVIAAATDRAAPLAAAAAFAGLAYGGDLFGGVFGQSGRSGFGSSDVLMIAFLIASGALAWRQRSRLNLHALLLLGGLAVWTLLAKGFALAEGLGRALESWEPATATVAFLWIGLGLWARTHTRPGARTLAGYAAWYGLFALGVWGAGEAWDDGMGLVHRILWLAAGIGAIALARADRHGWMLAAGIVSAIVAAIVLMSDLGLSLLTASVVFGLLAAAALVAAWLLGRNRGRAA
jgi:hypothetical protein